MTKIRLRTYHGLDIETADGARYAQASGPAEAAEIIRAVNALPAETTPPAPAFPIINLNGTAAAELQAQQRRLWDALHEAEKALTNAVPHGRDYQTAGDGTYAMARRQHDEHAKALQAMLRHVEMTWSAINDQVEERLAR